MVGVRTRRTLRSPKTLRNPGTQRRQYLEQNVGALDVALSEEDLAAIEAAVLPGMAAGDRYPERGMTTING